MVTRYTLSAQGQPIVSGALALVVTQAAAIAGQGQTAYVADANGRTARVAVNTDQVACQLMPATELFPTYDPNETPRWLTRAQQLINELSNNQ